MPLLCFIASPAAVTADPSATGIKPSRILFIKVPPIIVVGDFTPLLVFTYLLRLYLIIPSVSSYKTMFMVLFPEYMKGALR